jgi:hypothetical protein
MDGEPALLVGPSSATMGGRAWECHPNYCQEIKRNHSDMVKFRQHDDWYTIVKGYLNDIVMRIAQEAGGK